MHHPTHMQQLMAAALADQAEEAAMEYATTWQAVTAGLITQGDYYDALRADLEEEDARPTQPRRPRMTTTTTNYRPGRPRRLWRKVMY